MWLLCSYSHRHNFGVKRLTYTYTSNEKQKQKRVIRFIYIIYMNYEF